MPFIRGRYYINPIAGEALEAAREVEEALSALQHSDQDEPEADNYEWGPASHQQDMKGPIHHVEIETASLVPAHSGEAARGFVARVHRATHTPAQNSVPEPGRSFSSSQSSKPVLRKPETHVFANDGDLIDFLKRELAKDSAERDCTRGRQV
jgi:hypothetical protein